MPSYIQPVRAKMRGVIFAALSIALLVDAALCLASDQTVYSGRKDRESYSVGFQIGEDLARQKTPFDPAAFLKGIGDALSDAPPRFSAEEMRATLAELKKKIVTQQKLKQSEKRAEKLSNKEKYIGEGRDFLAANAKREGVVSLPGGLQYKILKKGSGKRPGPHDTVVFNYRGTLIDGREFGSSSGRGKPERKNVGGLVPGLKEALQLMREGSKWRIFLPSDLAFGERGPLADRAVIFDIELISVESSR
jgi:FKBP-type peptidyl-prolyl cis-trans isomerase FklB